MSDPFRADSLSHRLLCHLGAHEISANEIRIRCAESRDGNALHQLETALQALMAQERAADVWEAYDRPTGYVACPKCKEAAPSQRSRAEVLAARNTVVGCCERHADNKACDCLKDAVL